MKAKKHFFRKHPIWIIILLVMASFACGITSDLIGSDTIDEIIVDQGTEQQITSWDDMMFPPDENFEILFSIHPFGSFEAVNKIHTIRWGFYSVNMDIDGIEDFYFEYYPHWQVERDAVINGQRNIIISTNHPLSLTQTQSEFQNIIRTNPDLQEGVLDVELLKMPEHADLGRLAEVDVDQLPEASIIIVSEYLFQELEDTPTPEAIAETPETSNLQTACRQALTTSLCANPYFPPIEGLSLVYEIDGHRTQTRQIGPVQTGVQNPGDPPMDGFTVTFVDAAFTMEMDFFCTEEGVTGGDIGKAIASVLEGQEIEGEIVSFDEVTYAFDGVALPNDINPGDTWEAYVEMVMSGEGVHLITTNHARYFFEGYETVTTPAGTFETQKIIIDMDVDVTAFFPAAPNGTMPIVSVQISSVAYYAECIGQVMTEGDTSLKLIDMTLP